MKELVIIQTATPDYRAGFFKAIRNGLGDRFKLYRGARYFETSVITDEDIPATEIKNHFFLGRRALFQTGIWHLAFKDVILVLEMNPRIVSNWMLLALRKIAGKKTILWGHAWPREGKESKSDRLRQGMRSLATAIVVYTKQQANELKIKMPETTIYAAPNALISASKMGAVAAQEVPANLIYVGRLTPEKKPLFLAKAFAASLEVMPEDASLIFVGSGEEEQKLLDFIAAHQLEQRIVVKGHIADHSRLQELYATSIFSVSPGYVGLSLTQSLGFGVPMLISENEPHAPEIEAAVAGENGLFYKSDAVVSFRESVKNIYDNKTYWIAQRPEIAQQCSAQYTVEAMAQVFINLTEEYGA